MNRLFLLLGICLMVTLAKAEEMTLAQLHDMSNRLQKSAFCKQALGYEALLKQTTSAEWQREIGCEMPDSISLMMQPTLYDIIMGEYLTYNYGTARDSLYKAWIAFHEGEVLPQLYARYVKEYSLRTEVLCEAVDRMPDDHTKIYPLLLLKSSQIGRGDAKLHGYISRYLSRYPEVSIAEDLRSMLHRIEREEANCSSLMYFRSIDSLCFRLDITNSDTVICHLFPVNYGYNPLQAKLLHRHMSRLQPVWSDTICTALPKPFRGDTILRCPPLPVGCYQLVISLSGDTLARKPWWYYHHKTLYVNDLCSFAFAGRERDAKRFKSTVVVASNETGEPISGVRVRYFDRSNHRALRLTNRDGEARRSCKGDYTYMTYELHKGRKHHADDYQQHLYTFDNPSGRACMMMSNAGIFRPGDTLRLRVVSYEQQQGQRILYRGQWLHYRIRDSRWRNQVDSVIRLDYYGSAEIVFPVTSDMTAGRWHVEVVCKDSEEEVRNWWQSSDFYFQIEDYRMPTLTLRLDESNRRLNKAKVRPIAGLIERTNGMPLGGQEVSLQLRLLGEEGIDVELDTTVRTTTNGRFALDLPAAWLPMLEKAYTLRVVANCVTADGEEQNDRQSIFLSSKPLDEVKPRHYTPDDGFCPKDSILWLPVEGIRSGADSASLILGMPHQAAVYEVVASRDKEISRGWLRFDGLLRRTYAMPEGEDQYLDVWFYTIVDGEVRSAEKRLTSPKKSALRIVPLTFRDHLTPGAPEEWTFRLEDLDGRPREGRIALTMLDEALLTWNYEHDSIRQPWSQHLFLTSASQSGYICEVQMQTLPKLHNYTFRRAQLRESYSISAASDWIMDTELDEEVVETGHGSVKKKGLTLSASSKRGSKEVYYYSAPVAAFEENEEVFSLNVVEDNIAVTREEVAGVAITDGTPPGSTEEAVQTPLRQGDTRLALWRIGETDADGRYSLHFTAPLDNTRWHLYLTAWTSDLYGGTLTTTLTAQRSLMARVGAPRFMREGDRLTMPLVFHNASDTALTDVRYTASLLRHTAAGDSLLLRQEGTIRIEPKGETQTTFDLRPLTVYVAEGVTFTSSSRGSGSLLLRLTASLPDGTTDGEQRLVQVLPISEPVTEAASILLGPDQNMATLHLPVMPADARDAEQLLIRSANPLQVLIDDLPKERDTTAFTAYQLAHNLYTLALANHIAERYPAYREKVELQRLIDDLGNCRQSDGYRWMPDSRSSTSYYLTLHIMALLGELNVDGALPEEMVNDCKATVRYLDRTTVARKKMWDKEHQKDTTARYDYAALLQYAYVRSHWTETRSDSPKGERRVEVALSKEAQPIFDSVLTALPASLSKTSLVGWPLVAITLHQAGQAETAERIVNGLRRYALTDSRQGMRWENVPDYCWWYRKSEVHANFLRAFRLAGATAEERLQLSKWMIVNNRVTDWGHSSLSAYCVSQMLADTILRLAPAPLPIDTLRMDAYKEGNHMARAMRLPDEQWAWTAVIRRYTAPATEVKPFGTEALRLSRRYFVVVNDTTLRPLQQEEVLPKGTHLRVVLHIETDRELDYVTLRDARPAALEPIGGSRYHYGSSLPRYGSNGSSLPRYGSNARSIFYYEEVRNAREIFYIEHLPQGENEITYDTYVSFAGLSAAGLAAATSDLAPEITSHTAAALLCTE